MTDISALMTATRLRLVCPNARADILETIIGDAPAEFPKAGLSSHVHVAHFIAQVAAETGGLARLDENLNYTTVARLRAVFKSKFKTDAAARPFLRNPEALANFVYATKNGNTAPGDGWLYRGSGLIQLTGRGNFKTVGELVRMKLVADPELARVADSALAIALGFWTAHEISAVASSVDPATVKRVTRLVNPALVGLAEREAFFRKAIKAFTPPKMFPAVTLRASASRSMLGLQVQPPAAEPSGPHWVVRFPTSRSIDDLKPPFSKNVAAFVAALDAAGARVSISATFRPKERAYLMHWAWMVGKKGMDPGSVPPMAGVPISWSHPTLAKSRTAARRMVEAYGMVQVAALNSRHTDGLAIDMTISWQGNLAIRGEDGSVRTISDRPRNGSNSKLVAVGLGYGVVKLVTDPPHWSEDGR